ncbi:MAG: alpha/beta hydrolase [Rickettsiales bacterium]
MRILYSLIAIYLIVLAVVAVFQRKLLYIPDRNIGEPEQYGLLGFHEYFVKTDDNISIQLWYKPAEDNKPTIVYFHGNASHMGNRAGIYSALTNHGLGVLAVSYRGYGKSAGNPSERGLYKDARAAIYFLNESMRLPLNKIIIYGESLGTGVSTKIASEYDVGAVILQAPYISAIKRASEIYFFFPVNLVMLDKFNSISRIDRINCPLLILHGKQDEVIPSYHSETLLKEAVQPKKAIFFDDVGHNNFDSGKVAEEIMRFLKEYNLSD